MKARFNIAFLALIFLQSLAFGASAQVRIVRMGVANSFKDMGICVQTVEEGSSGFNNYSLLVNLGKVITGDAPSPGAKLHWCHQEIVHSIDRGEYRLSLYFGGGAVAGFVRDYSKLSIPNPGLMAGMTADAGLLLCYRGNVDIAIDWSAEMALHLRRDEVYNRQFNLSWYVNGLLHAWIPCLTIYYKF